MVVHQYIYTSLFTGHQRVCSGGGGSKDDVRLYISTYIPLCSQGINVSVVGVAAVKKTAALAQAGKAREANVHL